MDIRIALAGNPNSGKTTLFNALTGSNQFVGNWPGVTVEKKEGKLKKHDGVVITDLPGIYSLSPYTLEEVVARNYLLGERPDAILNIVDGTNLERNLYLTTQLLELGIPVVAAVNMIDVVKKNGDKIDIPALANKLGCPVVEVSALKGTGVEEAAKAAIAAAGTGAVASKAEFAPVVESALKKIEADALADIPDAQKRWYAVKLFERDEKVMEQMNLDAAVRETMDADIKAVEDVMDDDSESIITNERYESITGMLDGIYVKQGAGELSTSDKIDKVVTNRWLGLPIFILVMFLVYYLAVTTVGTWVTDWTNDGLFGDGWHMFGKGSAEYDEDMQAYADANIFTPEVGATIDKAVDAGVIGAEDLQAAFADKDYGAFEEGLGSFADELAEQGYDVSAAVDAFESDAAPDTSTYPGWVSGVPVVVDNLLTKAGAADWLKSLIVDGIIGGVGAVLGFVPQMLVLFFLLAILESSGYMARVAFILDRIFRRFGLSGKSFIPMLIGTGCGVPGVMASRTIENERDRRMTIMTTTFIPCGAKLPIIAMIATALFGGAWWVAPSAYFLGIAAVILSGIMLKKTKRFAGDPAPFVMELPAYHMPTLGNVLRSMWERGWSFIKKAGTIILLASIVIWLGSSFGWGAGADGASFGFNPDMDLEVSILGKIGAVVSYLFVPLGFANIRATIATVMGLVAKEEVVGVFGVLDFVEMTKLAAYSFLAFNLLCAPCFAAIGAIRREMNNRKWTWFAIGYQCLLAYAVSLIIYQIGSLFTPDKTNIAGLLAALLCLGFMIYMLVKPYEEARTLSADVEKEAERAVAAASKK